MTDPGDENDFKGLREFNLANLQVGQAVRAHTLNSTYQLRLLAGLSYRLDQVRGEQYQLEPNPSTVFAVSTGFIVVGKPLVMIRNREGNMNLIRTFAVQRIEEVL